MKINANQLEGSLKGGIRQVYVVSGDEPLLMQEACDAIRAAAREAGFTERELFHVDNTFDWHQLLYSANSFSLFGDRKLIELRMPTGKPGKEGGAVLQEYAADPAEDRVLLLITDRLDRSTQNTKWFKQVSAAGVFVQVWPVELRQMPGWLNDRIKRAGMSADRDAVYALVEKVEGNLLAAVQEIERIRLVTGGGRIDIGQVVDEVSDSSRFTVFGLIDAADAGDGKRAIRMLQGLQDEGIALLQITALLGREIRLLARIKNEVERGKGMDGAMRSAGVWSSRTRVVGAAANRHRARTFEHMLQQLARLDRIAKGGEGENPWDLLREIVAHLAGVHIALSAS